MKIKGTEIIIVITAFFITGTRTCTSHRFKITSLISPGNTESIQSLACTNTCPNYEMANKWPTNAQTLKWCLYLSIHFFENVGELCYHKCNKKWGWVVYLLQHFRKFRDIYNFGTVAPTQNHPDLYI